MDQVRSTLSELQKFGLDNTEEAEQLRQISDTAPGLPLPEELPAVLARVETLIGKFRSTCQKLHRSGLLNRHSLRAMLEDHELKKREFVVIESKMNLEEKYRNILGQKGKFKESVKELRLFELGRELEKEPEGSEKRTKLLLEKKYIEMMPEFEKVRNGVISGLMHFVNKNANFLMEKHYFDRNFFRREVLHNSERIERFEVQIKVEQEKRKKLKQKKFMEVLFQCKIQFDEFHKKRTRFLKKTANNAKLQLESQRKKKEEQEMSNEGRERRIAYEQRNFDIYTKMVKDAKNERIKIILQDTDRFLKEVAFKIRESKGIKQPSDALPNDDPNHYDFSKSALLENNYEEIYYGFTHTVNEDIKEQPTLLQGGQLKSYQLQGLRWLVSLYTNKLNGILADEMGLGKTIQTISLLAYLMEHKENFGPFLIVVPLATLSNWKMEFEKWAPSIKKVVYKGNPQDRKSLALYLKNNHFNVCITTYEYVLKDKSELSRFIWQYIIVDEGHKMKNFKSKFAQILGQQYNSEFRILLTGTPLQNNLTELWSLLNFLLPKVFTSCDDFEKWFKMPMKKSGIEKDIELNEEEKMLIVGRFHMVLRPFLLRRVKRDVESELPQKLEFIIKVDMSAWQKIVYNLIAQKEISKLTDNLTSQKIRGAVHNMLVQLRKICNHPYLFEENETEGDELIMSSGKFELLDRMIPKLIQTNHRMLIFTQMTKVIDLLELFMCYRNIKYLRLDGGTKHEDRAQQISLFNQENSPYSIFLLSTRAGGLGLNLQTADTVILFDSDWNPQMDLQAQDRAHRIGTQKEVRVFRLITNDSVEEHILSKASEKRNLDEMVIEAGHYNNRATDGDRRTHLEEIIKKLNLEKADEDEIPDDEEINKILARNDEEFNLFQKLDALRHEQERLRYPNYDPTKNYRLMGLEEVPDRIKQNAEAKVVVEEATVKKRTRMVDFSNIRDDDSLSEEEEVSTKERKRKPEPKQQVETKSSQIDQDEPKQEDDIYNESSDSII